MRILYVSRSFGGHDQRFVEAWQRAGLEVSTLTIDHGESLEDDFSSITRDGIQTRIDTFRPHLVQVGPLTRPSWDVIQVWSGPLIATSWGFDLLSEVNTNEEVARRARAVVDRADLLFVDNDATRRLPEEWGMEPTRIVQFPWGLDGKWFIPRDKAPFSSPQRITVLCVRRHESIYRVGDLIEAFMRVAAEYVNVRLRLAGSGSLTEQLKQQVHLSGLGARIEFMGELDSTRLSSVYRSADLYVTPSEVDGTSISLLEAMASGTPVIASRIDGNAEWVDSSTGLVFDVGSVEQLEAHIREFAQAEPTTFGEARRRAERAYARVLERADWSVTVSRFPQYAREAIENWEQAQ